MSQFVPTLPPSASAKTPSTLVERDGSGNFAAGAITATHLQTDTSTTPTISAGVASGPGTPPTPTSLTISGYDSMCTVTLQTATGGSSGAYFTVTYQQPFAKAPAVVPIPLTSVTAALSGNSIPHISSVTANGFSWTSNANILASLTPYQWMFLSIG